MANRHVVDEGEIARFNLQRENKKDKEFSAEEFKELLKKMGYSTSGNLIKCMTSGVNPPFVRIARGRYRFSKDPIYIERLQKVWDDYGHIGRNRLSTNPDKKQLELDKNRAIKLLKDLGYKVLKPVTQYEEV